MPVNSFAQPKRHKQALHKKTQKEERVRRGVSFEPEVLAALLKTANSQFNGDASKALNHILRKALKIQKVPPQQTLWRKIKQLDRNKPPFDLKIGERKT
jgi:hypothetical protein